MKSITRFSLANRGFVALLSIAVAAFGLLAISELRQELVPATKPPSAYIVLSQQSSTAQSMDERVVAPVAQALRNVQGVESIRSTATAGSAQLEVRWAHNARSADFLRDAREAVEGETSTITPAVHAQVLTADSADTPVVELAFTGGASLEALAERLEATVVPALEEVQGVRSVRLAGAGSHAIVITPNAEALLANQLDASSIVSAVSTFGQGIPVGTSEDRGASAAVRVEVAGASLDDLRALALPTVDGEVLVSDVATVAFEDSATRTLARADGHPSLSVSVLKSADADAVTTTHAVLDAVRVAVDDLGSEVAVHVLFEQASLIEHAVNDLAVEGLLGLVFAIAVILAFLRSWRATLITAASIPLSLAAGAIGLAATGQTLNMLTLAGLTIAIGRVVDDSIVVVENIKRGAEQRGRVSVRNVRSSVAEVASPVAASTLATVVVFLPVVTLSGVAGELFRPFALAVSIALVASLLVSLTIVPVLAYWFLRRRPAIHTRPKGNAQGRGVSESVLQRGALPAILLATRRPALVVSLSLAVLALTFVGSTFLKTDFLGSFGDERSLQVIQRLPAGTTLEASSEAASRVEAVLIGLKGVDEVLTVVGTSGPNAADHTVRLVDGASVAETVADARNAIGKLRLVGSVQVTGAANSMPEAVDVVVSGSDTDSVRDVAGQVLQVLKRAPALSAVSSNLQDTEEVLKVAVNPLTAAQQGVLPTDVSTAVSDALVGQSMGTVTLDGVRHEVVLRSARDSTNITAIAALAVPATAIQQQRAQREANARVEALQSALESSSREEGAAAEAQQLRDLRAARSTNVTNIAALRERLAELDTLVLPGGGSPVLDGDLLAANHLEAVEATRMALEEAGRSLTELDKQIAEAARARADNAARQALADEIASAVDEQAHVRAEPTKVSDVATLSLEPQPHTLTRRNGILAVTIAATPGPDGAGEAANVIAEALTNIELPPGVEVVLGGAVSEQDESFRQLGLAMLAAVLLVYLIMVLAFRSLIQPLILLVAIPFAATGVVLALLVTSTPIGVSALIGMMMLIGIVVTNAIVLLDLINKRRARGDSVVDSVVQGAQLRLRPIVMTASATILALVPMAFGFTGGGAFISQQLAIVVIGGLVSSTILTLVLVPALYVLAERRRRRNHDSARARAT